ncbi:MAG: TIGR02186 family protein [Bosea sp. (in: a-proteobacteria)]
MKGWSRQLVRLLALFAAMYAGQTARAEVLISSLSTHRVLIGSNYTGAQIAIFGSVEREGRTVARGDPYDIVVTVTGPRQRVLVREKDRRGLFWLNNEQHRFADAPAFMATFTTRTVAEMGSEEDARRLQIGLKNKLLPVGAGLSYDPGEARFTDALIRLKAQDKLYSEIERGVTFLTPSLFRARLELPANAPTGNYEVSIELFVGQVPLTRQQTSFEVVQIGFEQQVASFARNWSFIYGLATALTAILFGWLATIIFRRD